MKRSRWVFQLTLLVSDLLMATLAFLVAQRLQRAIKPGTVDRLLDYWPFVVIELIVLVVVFYLNKRYHGRRSASIVDSLSATAALVSQVILITLAAALFLLKTEIDAEIVKYPRGLLVYNWALAIALVGAGRIALTQLFALFQSYGYGRDRVLVVGSGEVGRMLVQKLRSSRGAAHEVVGYINANGEGPANVPVPVLGRTADLPAIIDQQRIDEVIIGLPEASHREIVSIISMCEREKVSIKVFPDVFQIMATEVSISDLGGLPLLTVRDVALRGWRLSFKRLFDLVFGSIGLILLSPLLLFIAVLIKLESPGPVFYIQERMGLDAKPFPMLKFRSMRTDAERHGPGWTTADDPRKTKLGALLRRISFDEFPQFINVVRGDMSLVGPRPERPVYVEQFRQYIPRYMERHREKAGVTGWAQVNGLRGDTSIVERTKYDLWYIENWSLWLDFKICVRTVFRIFADRNAY